LENIRREMDRLWDSFFEARPRRRGEVEELGGEWVPSLDLSETKDNFLVKAEIPGIEPKDVDISLHDDILTIKGQKKQSDKIKASYKDGILKIILPKSEEAKKKEVKIKVE